MRYEFGWLFLRQFKIRIKFFKKDICSILHPLLITFSFYETTILIISFFQVNFEVLAMVPASLEAGGGVTSTPLGSISQVSY